MWAWVLAPAPELVLELELAQVQVLGWVLVLERGSMLQEQAKLLQVKFLK